MTQSCTGFKNSNEKLDATINVNWGNTLNRVLPELFGSNLQWVQEGDGIGSPEVKSVGVFHQIKQMNVTSIRFPGGALANTYQWKKTIGIQSKRSEGLNYAGNKEKSRFGTDEFIKTCDELDVQAVITINPNDSIDNAVDWVEYMNGNELSKWGSKRKANNPDNSCYVKYWEIGNEIYAPNVPGFTDAKSYASQVKAFAKAMKAKDPSIKIGIVLEASFLQAAWMGNIFPHIVTWNEDVLKEINDEVDFVSVHFYAPSDTIWDDSKLNKLVWSSSIIFSENLKSITQLIKKHSSPNIKIGVTEYGTFFGEETSPLERIESTENALFIAQSLFVMMRDENVIVANNWSLVNNSRFGLLKLFDGKIIKRPSAYVFEQLASLNNGHRILTSINSPHYRVDAKGNVPTLESVPIIDAVSIKKPDNSLAIAIINRSPNQTIELKINIINGNSFNNKLATIHHYDPHDSNMTALKWQINKTSKNIVNSVLSITLRPGSFTLVNLSE